LGDRRTRLSEWERLQHDYHEGLRDGDHQKLLVARRRIHDFYPGYGQAAYGHGWAALRANRPREAIEAFQTVDPEMWGNLAYTWVAWADACFQVGDHEEELRVSRVGKQLYPDRAAYLANEARALTALGRMEELDSLLTEVRTLPSQERLTPGFTLT